MRIQTEFDEAVASFQRFLSESGHPTDIVWVFRDDVWRRFDEVLINCRSAATNLVLTKKVFDEGCEKGLVGLHAVAIAGDRIAATVWFPKFPAEEVQGWDCGMKLSISQPLPHAKVVSPFRWFFFRFVPLFRHYQRAEWTIGTKSWAAA